MPAREPEIIDIATLKITWVQKFEELERIFGLKESGITWLSSLIIPDRIEAGTYLEAMAAAMGEGIKV